MQAMVTHPELVAGTGRFTMICWPPVKGSLLLRTSGESCFGIGLVDQGIGIAVKIEDGGDRALGPSGNPSTTDLNCYPKMRWRNSPLPERSYSDLWWSFGWQHQGSTPFTWLSFINPSSTRQCTLPRQRRQLVPSSRTEAEERPGNSPPSTTSTLGGEICRKLVSGSGAVRVMMGCSIVGYRIFLRRVRLCFTCFFYLRYFFAGKGEEIRLPQCRAGGGFAAGSIILKGISILL